MGYQLKVDKAIEPTLILWENLGFSMKHRCIRTLLTTFICLLFMTATLFIMMYMKEVEYDIQTFNP